MNKKKIGIIGSGAAGMTSAWLLDQEYEIILFEKEPELGGHACSVPITKNNSTIVVEAGAEFFSDAMFTEFNKLLKILEIPVQKYPLTYTFYNTKTGQTIVLPPLHDNAISWGSLEGENLFDLIEFKRFSSNATTVIAHRDTDLTIEDYCNTIELLSDNFKHQFLYPFFAASWGITPEEVKTLSAYNILLWVTKHQPSGLTGLMWNEIIGGMNSYIQKMATQLRNTRIITNAQIISISYPDAHYHLKQKDGTITIVDHLIIATNAHQAQELLAHIPHAQTLKKSLARIDYFDTTIAIHGDKRLMPKNHDDWTIANIAFDGKYSALTVCKPRMKEHSIFRSWITYRINGQLQENELPKPLYAIKHFYHPKPTPSYFQTQKTIAQTLGHNNLWIAGFYTTDVDSHNSAIISAIHIAKKLAPKSKRLAQLIS
jgi:predicted NAD/FAD-binding protein